MAKKPACTSLPRSLLPLLLLLAGFCAAVPVHPARQPLPGAEVYRRTLAGLAWVQASDRARGSGWIIDRQRRLLVTSYHVVGDNDACEAVFPWRDGGLVSERRRYLELMPELRKRGLCVPGRVLRRNPAADLALVELERLPEGAAELPLASRTARPGDRVHVVGNRFDLEVLWGYGAGTVRAVRTLREGYFNSGRQLAKGARVLMASAPINEGDSGGPLVNDAGEVVGVSAAVAWGSHGAGLFIDLTELRTLLGASPATISISAGPADVPGGREVYRRAMRSVALVQVAGGSRFAGVLLDRGRRVLLTTAEAVAKEETVEVVFPVEQAGGVVVEAAYYRSQRELLRRKGAVSTGVVLAVDARRNLALVEAGALPPGASELPLAKTGPAPGDTLHLISHPQRLDVLWLYSDGRVRQRDHVNLGQQAEGDAPAVVIVQAPLAEGEGGGPMLDARGELAGILSGKIGPQQQIAFALDIREVRDFLDEVRPRSTPKTPAEHVQRGALFVRARQYDRALAAYTAAITPDRRAASALSGRARVHILQGDYNRALADADEALRLDPNHVPGYCHRAAARCGRREPAKAIRDCDAALKLDARCALVFALRGRARLMLGNVDGAVADADEAVWLDGKLALACRVRGQAFVRKNDTDRALADFHRAVLLDPYNAEGFVLRGELHWRRSDTDAALADFRQALKRAPGDPAALHGRGLAHAARGEYDDALADFDAVVKFAPGRTAVYIDRGSERLRRGQDRTGAADLLFAARKEPGRIDSVLAELERRTRDRAATAETAARGAEVCQTILQGVAPLLAGRPNLRARIVQGVEAAGREADGQKRAKALLALAASVRGELAEEK